MTNIHGVSSNQNDEDDEFGDASFLMDFDVDHAIASRQQHQPPTSKPIRRGEGIENNAPEEAASDMSHKSKKISNTAFTHTNKRQKVSTTLPSGTTTTIASTTSTTTRKISNYTTDDTKLENTLEEYFGFPAFRKGQKQVIESVLNGNDVAVFWATGAGKSLCYQIPALHTQRITLIVSPLISLMQDQVHKLNGNTNSHEALATYLGSGQLDPMEEQRALMGGYTFVYVTPEKLLSSNGEFLNRLAQLDLCLIAIDESHCVSEWGHDFRKDYRQAGSAIRNHSQLRTIPIMALTATAVPKIQNDIISNLQLNNPIIVQQSFDRPNLNIRVVRKDRGGNAMRSALEPLIQTLLLGKTKNKDKKSMPTTLSSLSQYQSTIIYAPTRSQVDEVTSFLQQRLQAEQSPILVQAYHAGLPAEERQEAHNNFLIGKTTVIVATIAFGMGIDKPDTRRVIHYGAPKTVEEYYQQIGRAGRDGLPAECTMYITESDFDRYLSDFYLGNLNQQVKASMKESISAMRSYALDEEACRRKTLLTFFHEIPPFGDRCGTCDTCLSAKRYGSDSSRDFRPIARIILIAVESLSQQGMTTLLQVINGKVLEGYRYKRGMDGTKLQQSIQSQRSKLSQKYTVDEYRDLINALVSKSYLQQETKSSTVNGFQRSWTVYSVLPKGQKVLQDPSIPVILPVPKSIRALERQEEEKRQRILEELERKGISRQQLPQDEVESGDGEVIRAYSKWHGYIDKVSKKEGMEKRVQQLDSLLSIIQEWRSKAASMYRMAPASVLPEHILVSIAYTTATLPAGLSIDQSSLRSAGVRTKELDSLVEALDGWLKASHADLSATTSSEMSVGHQMILPDGPVTPNQKWPYAVYKPLKKTGLASWESSYQRFQNGENPQAIAMSPANGRPIQVPTVIGHIQEALMHGQPVDLKRLSQFNGGDPPDKEQWEELEEAERKMGMSVVGEPMTSGWNGSKFTMTDFLRPIMGDQFVDTPYTERSEEQKEDFSRWCNHLKWYMNLKRAGITPTFEG